MSKHPKHVEIKKCLQAGDNVKASLIFEEAATNFFKFMATDRDTRICCQNWITELAHDFITLPCINITRAP